MLRNSESTPAGEFTLTVWSTINLLDRLKFLFTGKITVIEQGLTSNKSIRIGEKGISDL